MDCQTALEILEVVRPHSEDLCEEEVAAAAAHLESCSRCSARFEKVQELDVQIQKAMGDVPVPAHLKENLLELAASSPSSKDLSEEIPETESTGDNSTVGLDPTFSSRGGFGEAPRRPFYRRTWFSVSSAVAVAVLILVVSWLYPGPSADQLRMQDLYGKAHLSWQQLSKFDDSFAAPLPRNRWEEVLSVSGPRGIAEADSSGHAISVYKFALSSSRRKPVRGFLLVVPRDRVQQPPAAETIHAGPVNYISSSTEQFAVVSWTQDQLVYVCMVRDGARQLEELQQALEITPA